MITKDTLREYHSKPGISKTKLWRIIEKSPQWFKYCADNPPEFNSPALMFGAALHKAVLEPDGFGDEYIVAPKFDRRTKDGKAAYAAFEMSLAGRTYDTAGRHGGYR